jgi:hypothetical protein
LQRNERDHISWWGREVEPTSEEMIQEKEEGIHGSRNAVKERFFDRVIVVHWKDSPRISSMGKQSNLYFLRMMVRAANVAIRSFVGQIQERFQWLYQTIFTQSDYEMRIFVDVSNHICPDLISIQHDPNSLICRIGKEIWFIARQLYGHITNFTCHIDKGKLVLTLTKLHDQE